MKTLIEIDGPDYSGKSTLIENLKKEQFLKNAHFCRMPGESYLGELLRPVFKEYTGLNKMSSFGVTMAMLADTYQHLTQVNSDLIVSDRGICSTVVYQGQLGRLLYSKEFDSSLFLQALIWFKEYIKKNFKVKRILLDISYEEIFKRKQNRVSLEKDKYDNMPPEKFREMIESYRQLTDRNCKDLTFSKAKLFAGINPINTFKIEVKEKTPEQMTNEALELIKQVHQ